ncbi:uncharacterized protein LODBEIA_P35520 [Lodderomyces beijingensis]|uniref:TEA domain-containing protein n=1 Tax=Lodderomyces beijingensis TaxID=1775926 RepID=A0ABP0ZME2_9ASCO
MEMSQAVMAMAPPPISDLSYRSGQADQQQFASRRNKPLNQGKLPLIVDIALDADGKQLYQVHETSSLVREAMPISNNFSHDLGDSAFFTQNVDAARDGNISPRTVLGISHSAHYEMRNLHLELRGSAANLDGESLGVRTDGSLDHESVNLHQGQAQLDDVRDDEIWSSDVEEALEEVLQIIPKNGLSKIKIAGRSCGRNELISDYIFMKTGKRRTRKQVSSHIQVIKNLEQNHALIELINEGPKYSDEMGEREAIKRFEKVFHKINLTKSLGFSHASKRKIGIADEMNELDEVSQLRLPDFKKRKEEKRNKSNRVKLKSFFMSVHDQYSRPAIFTVQRDANSGSGSGSGGDNDREIETLVLSDDSILNSRFPGLEQFMSCPRIPKVHNMVKIFLSDSVTSSQIEAGFKSNYRLTNDDGNYSTAEHGHSNPPCLNLFTCVFSYGKQVLKLHETGIQLNENREFLAKFWKFFFSTHASKSYFEIGSALKGITIKQVIYDATGWKQEGEASLVSKSRVNIVLLWEFAKVKEMEDACTTTSLLTLQPHNTPTASAATDATIRASWEDVMEQRIEHEQRRCVSDSTDATTVFSLGHAAPAITTATVTTATAATTAADASLYPEYVPDKNQQQASNFYNHASAQSLDPYSAASYLNNHHHHHHQHHPAQEFSGDRGHESNNYALGSSYYQAPAVADNMYGSF